MTQHPSLAAPLLALPEPSPQRYAELLAQVALAPSDAEMELYLAEAFELGRAMVDQQVPPDAIAVSHHEALVRFASSHPELVAPAVADRLTRPLMEVTMAYGMAFREQIERRYDSMLTIRLEESRKLEAIGTLAAGIAHDFNNLLGSIVGFAEMAGDHFAEGDPGKRDIQQVLNASFRARDLVARLLAFARQSPVKPVVMALVPEVRDALALLKAALRPSVLLDFETDVDQASILADPSQIQQIVMNLCINAADAMTDHGTIVIRLAPVLPSPADGTHSAPQVCLTVADHGTGMPRETLERIFDPFFTTKAPGKGSGLGLSVVYRIVQSLGGTLQVESRTRGQDRGTEFRICLPLVDNLPTQPET